MEVEQRYTDENQSANLIVNKTSFHLSCYQGNVIKKTTG